MDHADHVALLRDGVPHPGGHWADLGAGTGAFTLALAELLGPSASIAAVDRDDGALREGAARMATRFPTTTLLTRRTDFVSGPLPFEAASLDGIVMANSLHFVADKPTVLPRLVELLRPRGSFLLVEYDTDRGNPWVPHPISFAVWSHVAPTVGLTATRLIGRVPSRFLGAIYSAASARE
jgi:ubiquinone/menaquinone biosynthesis C-methylase UbiE